MTFTLERGGGAFKVDALSGWDLYDAEAETDTKVLTLEETQFRQLVTARRNIAGSNSGSSLSRHHDASSMEGVTSSLAGPLPSQVSADDAELREAILLSISETQKQRNEHKRSERQYNKEYHKAVSESQAEQAAYGHARLNEDITFRRALSVSSAGEDSTDLNSHLLKQVTERSIRDEAERRESEEQRYEDELKLALEQSAAIEQKQNEDDEEQYDVLGEIIKLSAKEAEIQSLSEEDAINQALEMSKTTSGNANQDVLLREVMRLSLAEQHAEKMDEEEALRKAIEESMYKTPR
jgi:hypothetical protein